MKSILLAIATLTSAYAGEFTELFNGRDLTNWGGKDKTEHAGYEVKDGTITSTPKCRVLMTEKEYSNYVLQFEFKLTSGANNGLGIHYPGKGDAAYTGMEIQILDNTHKKYAGLKDYQFHGGLYTLVAAKKGHLKPVGEWNKETVTVNGPHVKVELNGVVIMEANLDEVNKSHPKHEGAKRRKGHIAFCGHGDIVSFQNIKIKELAAGDKKEK
jgi:hypothetical protein